MAEYPHMMYDPKTGKGVKVDTYEQHLELKDKGFSHKMTKSIEGKILKTDDEQRMVYGWASVIGPSSSTEVSAT